MCFTSSCLLGCAFTSSVDWTGSSQPEPSSEFQWPVSYLNEREALRFFERQRQPAFDVSLLQIFC